MRFWGRARPEQPVRESDATDEVLERLERVVGRLEHLLDTQSQGADPQDGRPR